MRTIPAVHPKKNQYGCYEIRWSEMEHGVWRSKRRSTKTDNRAEAERALNDFLAIKDANLLRKGTTVAEVAEFYIKHRSHPRGNEMTDRRCLRAPLEAFGSWLSHTLRDDDIEAYTRRRLSGAYGPKKVSGSTIRREIVALQAALNFGSLKKQILGSPTYRFPKPQEGKPRDRWLNEEQEREVLEQLPQAPLGVRVMVRLALTYGARKGAIMSLRFGEQISFVTNTIDFHEPNKRVTRKRRAVVPMTATVRKDIEEAFATFGPQSRVCGKNVDNEFSKFMASIGYDWVTPHVLKHSAITLMLRSGSSTEDVAKLTATDIRTILKVYRHHSADELLSIAERRRV